MAFNTDELAQKALAIMEMVSYDSFGTVDAVRALAEYEEMTPAERQETTVKLRALIDAKVAPHLTAEAEERASTVQVLRGPKL